MHLDHQFHRFINLRDVFEELTEKSVGRNQRFHLGSACQRLDFGRNVGYPCHISRIGLHIQVQLGLEEL